MSTSIQIPDPPSRTAEAMDIGVSEKPLSTESEGDSSRVSSGEEEELLADPSEAAAVEAELRKESNWNTCSDWLACVLLVR